MIGSEFSKMRYVTAKKLYKHTIKQRIINKIRPYFINVNKWNFNFEERTSPLIVDYKKARNYLLPKEKYPFDYFPCVINDWDNTARAGNKSLILHESTPALWQEHLQEACKYVENNTREKQIIFIKSWNEWAEANYLEPDTKWGFGYLKVVKIIKEKFNKVN